MNSLFVALTLLSSVAYAGIPDEDFTVDLTRESFIDGVKPSESDLYANYQWVCGSYLTRADRMTGTAGITLNEVFFVKNADGIINRSLYYPNPEPLAANDRELFSTVKNDEGQVKLYYAIRKNHGGLLIERAIVLSPDQMATVAKVESIAFPGLHAVAYSYCLPYDSASKAPKIMNVPWGDVWSDHK